MTNNWELVHPSYFWKFMGLTKETKMSVLILKQNKKKKEVEGKSQSCKTLPLE